MKGNKGKKRGMQHRRWTHDLKHRSFSRGSRAEDQDLSGVIALRHQLERTALREVVIDLTEATEPVVAEPFFVKENVGTVTIGGFAPTKAAPATERRTGRSTPWDGMAATLPWRVPGSPRTSVCA